FGDAFTWYYRNQFELSPGSVQAYRSTANITWNIKMLYGLLFDNFPLLKRHHQPWLMISAIVAFVGFIGLGIPEASHTPDSTLAFFWFALMGMAMSDVITDAMVVKRARLAGQRGGANLQTFCWIMLYVGSLTGRPTAGTINGEEGEGSRTLMKYIYSTSAVLLFVAACFLTEKPGNVKWSITRTFYQVWRLIKGVLFNTKVLLPISWIVFSNAIVPDVSSGMAYWKLDVIDIGADVQSYIDTAADLFAMFGLGLYAAYFQQVPFRTIFAVTQVFSAVLLISDNVLFYRWNTKIGIPDIVFMLGSDSIYYILSQVQAMPFLIMAAQLCPADIEATFYATMTSLSNAGSNASTRWGGFLLNKLGIVATGVDGKKTIDYTNLGTALWIRFGLAFSPLLLIWLVPNVSVIDAHGEMQQNGEEGVTAAEMDQLEEAAQNGDKLAQEKLAQEAARINGAETPEGDIEKAVSVKSVDGLQKA
ncbi:hypothetical protein HK102_004317, partial [Quaeritorhiza haematococci]